MPGRPAHSAPARRPGTAGSRPHTAASRLSYASGTSMAATLGAASIGSPTPTKRFNSARKALLKDNTMQEEVLPQPLPPGMTYVANFTTFDDLIDRRILHQTTEEAVHLTSDEVRQIYMAKCVDQRLRESYQRELRFVELLGNTCKGSTFSLKENGLGQASAYAIADVLATNKSFCIVDLSGNRLRDNGAIAIAELLDTNRNVVHLSLKSNDIGQLGGEAIAYALERNNTLTSLDFGGISGINRNHLGMRGSTAIGRMLTVNQTLCTLNISSNGLGSEGMSLLATGMEQNSVLTNMNLASNNLGYDGAKVLAAIIPNANLKHLNLERNVFGDKGATVIGLSLKQHGEHDNIVTLNLANNNIRQTGARYLGEMLRSVRSMETLHLDHNDIGDGALEVADALRENRCVKTFTVSHSDLLPAHGVAFAAAIGTNSTLTHFDLTKNRIGNDGTRAIAEALKRNHALIHLSLAMNGINDEGGEALATMLQHNRTLQELNLRQNMMQACGELFSDVMRKNSSLLTLDFTYNNFSFGAYQAVGASLSKNQAKWRENAAPRLEAQIEGLDYAEKELYRVQDDIEAEKRSTKERMEEGFRRKEVIKSNLDLQRRQVAELEETHSEVKGRLQEMNDELDAAMSQDSKERSAKDMQKGRITNKIEMEVDSRDRLQRDIDKLRKQITKLRDQEDEALRPFTEELEKADEMRNEEKSDAQRVGDIIVKTEMRVKELKRRLGLDTELEEKAKAKEAQKSAAGGGKGATRPGSGKAKKPAGKK